MLGLVIGAPIAGNGRHLTNDETFDVRTTCFGINLGGAVVADLRIGQDNNLAAVGRVGEDLLVSGDGCVKDHFTGALNGRTKASALEDGSIFQDQDCLLQRLGSSDQVGAHSAKGSVRFSFDRVPIVLFNHVCPLGATSQED